jgi:hypothetical protein
MTLAPVVLVARGALRKDSKGFAKARGSAQPYAAIVLGSSFAAGVRVCSELLYICPPSICLAHADFRMRISHDSRACCVPSCPLRE